MGKNKKNKKEKEKEEKRTNDCSDFNEQKDNIEHAKKKDKKHKKNKKNLKQDIDDLELNQKSDKKLKIANDNHKNEPVQQTDIEEKVEYPYEVDKDDHCETPLDAYLDIMPILMEICKNTGKSTQELAIYDPYFCQGRMKENLATIGFTNVYNKKEDFYKVIEAKKVPNYDVLITNPPYSEEHIQKIVDFCVKSEKPWFLLVPNFVYNKDWYLKLLKQKDPCKFHKILKIQMILIESDLERNKESK
ncbi:hypothetical protein PPERSA_04299 [Pseudocohnilembus persalinus]|uniref:Uncharacterized protein n=1 Tax=Pseudocohnilembus persalinus TaxID=266149 RepID=A0A0V0QN93_PSEPJ|nr:hypothetical protein PPERSA_04299 [Pseudocohnilembus persalinus]|eukprot:KRX03791.1 hypothetical protein PPERSA_04299 [Pseudocohnilembus persalinus]